MLRNQEIPVLRNKATKLARRHAPLPFLSALGGFNPLPPCRQPPTHAARIKQQREDVKTPPRHETAMALRERNQFPCNDLRQSDLAPNSAQLARTTVQSRRSAPTLGANQAAQRAEGNKTARVASASLWFRSLLGVAGKARARCSAVRFRAPTKKLEVRSTDYSELSTQSSALAPRHQFAVPCRLCNNAAMVGRYDARRAMTLVEALLAGLGLGVVLWVLSGLYDRGLTTARVRQARELLGTLSEALDAYHDAAGAYVPGWPSGSCEAVFPAMLGVPASAEVLATLDVRLLHLHNGRPKCLDPWGRPVRYVTSRMADPDLRSRVTRHHGRPIFESAGPDGRFGRGSDAASADDLATDEPGLDDRSPPRG